jgi:hypothetical protein
MAMRIESPKPYNTIVIARILKHKRPLARPRQRWDNNTEVDL